MDGKKKILIVEDESPLRHALSDKLTQENYEVIEAANGKIGLDIALAEKPDLILLDVIMPVMTGVEVIQHLQEDEWGKTAKIIILTNLSEDIESKMVKIKTENIEYYIKTDIKLEEVLEKIKEKLAS